MKVLSFTEARRNFAKVLDAVIDDAEETIIPRPNGQAVVLVSLSEWNSLTETLHVMGTAENARRLLASMAQLDAGLGEEHELIDPDQPATSIPTPRSRSAA